jgi:hypothetical protein
MKSKDRNESKTKTQRGKQVKSKNNAKKTPSTQAQLPTSTLKAMKAANSRQYSVNESELHSNGMTNLLRKKPQSGKKQQIWGNSASLGKTFRKQTEARWQELKLNPQRGNSNQSKGTEKGMLSPNC